jgi:membrane protein
MEKAWLLLRRTVGDWIDDEAPSMGAALAFYTLFSLAPLLILVLAIAGFVIGADAAGGLLFDELSKLFGENGAKAIQAVLAAASDKQSGIIAAAISFLTLVLGATTVFGELTSALNRIWKCKAQKSRGAWGLIRSRVLSMGLVVTIGFLLLVSLVLNAAVTALGASWGGGKLALLLGTFVVSIIVETLLFAVIYKVLPNVRIAWRDVWIGAAATAVLFEAGKFLIGLYLGKGSVSSAFGAAGTLVAVIVWVYYSAQVFFLGAEFTHVRAMSRNPAMKESDPSIQPFATRVATSPDISSPSALSP